MTNDQIPKAPEPMGYATPSSRAASAPLGNWVKFAVAIVAGFVAWAIAVMATQGALDGELAMASVLTLIALAACARGAYAGIRKSRNLVEAIPTMMATCLASLF